MADVVTRKFLSGFQMIMGDWLNTAFSQINDAFAAPSASGSVAALDATATTAGGATSPALKMGTAGVGVYFGSGAPSISAPHGSLYLNTSGSSTSTRLYVNSDGATTWVAVTTAS